MNEVRQKLLARLRSVASLIAAMLHELFDESAYARFLSRNQMISSRQAYAAFLIEIGHLKARRPRCC